jgi:NAD(P)-dependent dehydrogenase (short-subunit alcohol dehydrogenase family)
MVNEPENRTCRIPRACDASELQPLIQHLEGGQAVQEPIRFPRGTLTPDGRLDLCKQDVGPRNIERVAMALRGNAFVKSLLLGADFIADAGAGHIAALLEVSPAIETLFLGCNGISPSGLKALCLAAEGNPRLRGLWLKRNRIGPEGAEHVARLVGASRSLRTLDLADTGLESEGLATVVRALSEKNRFVERLYVCSNALTARDAATLGDLVRSECPLQELYLRANRIGDEGCEILLEACSRSPHLRVLGLSSNGISARGAAAVAAILGADSELTTVELGQAAGMELHGASPNRIGDQGATVVAHALKQNVALQRLFLGGNFIGAVGGMALLDALSVNRTISHLEVGRHVPRDVKRQLSMLISRNNQQAGASRIPKDIAQVRSVYRTQSGSSNRGKDEKSRGEERRNAERDASPDSRQPIGDDPPRISGGDLETCVRVLRGLTQTPSVFFTGAHREVRSAANQLVAAIVEESRRRKPEKSKRQPEKARPTEGQPPEPPLPAPTDASHKRQEHPGTTKPTAERRNHSSPRCCYVCKSSFVERHHHYELLCPACAELNLERRNQSADLSGHVALITGGRIKIGHETALKLLRAGCTVFVTTRFPRDASERFCAHETYREWNSRLHIIGLDLRDLTAVNRLVAQFTAEIGRLDILINNAAMTIHRPPSYYASLIDKEIEAPKALPSIIHPFTEPYRTRLLGSAESSSAATLLPGSGLARSVVMAGFTLVPSNDLLDDSSWFPKNATDADGVQLDLRTQNSWSASVEDVSMGELLEVHLVSSFAPFVLVRDLLPLLRRSPARPRHVVNVSAMEGSFGRTQKTERHPHTNMAKAGLNMLTRTVANRLGVDQIFVNSVDTGWATDERPVPQQEADGGHRFVPPLDVVDGAARVCDPIFRSARGDFVGFGQFLKDYKPTEW